MDKNAIKKYAVWARNELIARVSQKAQQYGITAEGYGDKNADSVNGVLLSATEKKQRQALIAKIDVEGFEQVMEEVAYTWFNRFTALRFMEVNNYLPSHTRVFTNEANEFKPQILADAISLELEGLDMDKVYELKDANKDEELYKYLLIVQCNALSSILPGMFQKIADYTELLLPDYLLREGSVVEQMVCLVPADDWTDQVQIIGWLYQYYNSEPKDKVFEDLKKNIKITKENIPAATQLFTPDWVVRYMVENSLGRLWLDGHPDRNLQDAWKYYLPDAVQNEANDDELKLLQEDYSRIKPEEILTIDPCSGSGHVLCYMFDILVQIYEHYGYSSREAVGSIVENNIWGLDIDGRAAQLAYFSVMMKARQYDRRFFSRGIQPHIYEIVESNCIQKEIIEAFAGGNESIYRAITTVVKELYDAKEYGSAIKVSHQNWNLLFDRIEELGNATDLFSYQAKNEIKPLLDVAMALEQKYDAIITNPPYMGINGMASKLSEFCKSEYPNSKSDLCTIMMEKSLCNLKRNGLVSMINMPVWMFISSFEDFRYWLVDNTAFVNLLHFGRGVFGSDFGSVAFTIRNRRLSGYKGAYLKLYEKQGGVDSLEQKEKWFFEKKDYCEYVQDDFRKIPGAPIAYWVGENVRKAFQELQTLDDVAEPKQGIATADNNRFLRLWFEVSKENTAIGVGTGEEAEQKKEKWYPYSKGGEFRKWYGNNDYVVNWRHNGQEIKNFKKAVVRNSQYHLREGITWTWISISYFGARYQPQGFVFDVAGSMMFSSYKYNTLLAYMCSKVADYFLKIINPTINFSNGVIAKLPINIDMPDRIEELAQECIDLAKSDWDSFETSWDYLMHPLYKIRKEQLNNASDVLISDCYNIWENECRNRFNRVHDNEIEINQIFIYLYGLEGELTSEVPTEETTIKISNYEKDIRSLISYAVGCMFGRYSLDKTGLLCAGDSINWKDYSSFIPDEDNIIPICDDEYFEDDIVSLFVEFIKNAFGEKFLEENLTFIANALPGKGSSRDVIRNYFLNEFYFDHCTTYSVTGSGKRPIYWMFDSGKKNGFKCLVYMHRYQPDTIARIRTDYVHEQQSRYRTALADLEQRINSASTNERVKLNKQLKTIQDQAEELRKYEEKIHHLADQMISIDLDDGVKENYAKFQDVLAKIK